MQILKFLASFSNTVQKHNGVGFDAFGSGLTVSSSPSENLAVVILLLPMWLGEGLGQALCTHAWRRQ